MSKPRGVLIAGNWKMNLGPKETEQFLADVKKQWAGAISASSQKAIDNLSLKACIIPPVICLEAAKRTMSGLPISLGAQNAHWEKKGPFTGELSGAFLQELGVQYVLTGHSERRQLFGETDEMIRQRTEGLLAQDLRVILCVGETQEERVRNQTSVVLLRQLSAVLPEPGRGAAKHLNGRLIIAYEPVWAIGTGLTATPEQAEEGHEIIRKFLKDRFGKDAASQTPLLYGGSVTPENISSLLACPNVDGGLVGSASLKSDGFLKLIEAGGHALATP